MIWNADLAIVYACALTLLGALLLWALPTLFFAAVHVAQLWTRRLAAPKSTQPVPSRSQALSARFPHLMR